MTEKDKPDDFIDNAFHMGDLSKLELLWDGLFKDFFSFVPPGKPEGKRNYKINTKRGVK